MSRARDDDPRRQELIRTAFRLRGTEFSRCFAPGALCDEAAIHAHSVQNAKVLDHLAREGHVIAPTHKMDVDKGILVELSEVGRNKATTFAGLCRVHDAGLFAAIENHELDLANPEHLFLLAYRAVIYELHACSAAGWMLQLGYQKRVELGLDPKDEPSPAGLRATGRLAVAYDTYLYKLRFDEIHESGPFASLTHDVLRLDVQTATVAASAMFSLDELFNAENQVVRVCLTIVPIAPTQTVAVLSYLAQDAALARAHLARIIQSSGAHQKYELSRHLLNHCSNFVLAPAFVDTWTAEKRQLITDYFARTVLENDLSFEHPDLMLFSRAA
jgi:hypothetical protein